MTNPSSIEFLDVAAHDLRTWMTIIYGGVNLLKSRFQEMDEENRLLLIGDIEGASEKLRQAVEGMLLVARLEAGRAPAADPSHLHDVVSQVAAAFSQVRPLRRLHTEIEETGPVVAVRAHVEYILRTLLVDIDQVAAAEAVIDVRAGGRSAREAMITVTAPVEQKPQAEFLALEYGGGGEGEHGRHLAPLVVRRLVEDQSGSMTARLTPEDAIEVSFTLPYAG